MLGWNLTLDAPEKKNNKLWNPGYSKEFKNRSNIIIIRCKCFFLFIGREPSTWPANNCLQVMVCAMSSIFVGLQIMNIADRFASQRYSLKKKSRWSNDETIIELGYRKISWFASVSQFNYLPQRSASAINWFSRHWQITIVCSTSSNNC